MARKNFSKLRRNATIPVRSRSVVVSISVASFSRLDQARSVHETQDFTTEHLQKLPSKLVAERFNYPLIPPAAFRGRDDGIVGDSSFA